jgi:hypothetical protein
MNNELLNILHDGNHDFDSQKLIDYVNGSLSDEEKHEVEKWMADNRIGSDAIEGLQNIKDKKDLPLYVEQLNKNLQEQLQKKKEQREQRTLKEPPWIYFAVILVLLLCIVGFFVLRMLLDGHR